MEHRRPSQRTRGAGAVGVCYVIDGLPLHVDWHVYPRSQAVWVADTKVIFDPHGLPRLNNTFYEHQEKREVQPATPKALNAHRLLQVSLIPVAAAGRYLDIVEGVL